MRDDFREVKIYFAVVGLIFAIALIAAFTYHKTEYGTVITVCMNDSIPCIDVKTSDGRHINDIPNDRNYRVGDSVKVDVGLFRKKVH